MVRRYFRLTRDLKAKSGKVLGWIEENNSTYYWRWLNGGGGLRKAESISWIMKEMVT